MSTKQPLPFLDAHAHVQAPQFDADRDIVLARARTAGVGTIVCSADDEASSRAAVALAERDAGVWATIGVHPHEAAHIDTGTFERMYQLGRSERVVAVGEIGLDYFRDLSPRPVQREIFRLGLALAVRLALPIVVHSRDAAEDTFAALQEWRTAAPGGGDTAPGVIHCFGYDAAWAERFLQLGFLISIPGTVTYPKALALHEVTKAVPQEMLLVETDCPYLPPQPWRGKRNEPSYLPETVRAVAGLRGVDTADLARTTAENAIRLFELDLRTGSAAGALRGAP